MLFGAEPVARDDRIRAMFAELLSLPAAEVRDALGLAELAPLGAGGPTSDEQRYADAIATALAHLGWLIRRHPRLAPALQWELAGLTPAITVPWAELDAIAATAAAVGARVLPARYAGPDVNSTTTVVELSANPPVRLVLATLRPPVAAAG